jgi:hypothetical protein
VNVWVNSQNVQEFLDHTAATAAKNPGSCNTKSTGRSGNGSDTSLDMRNWAGDRTGAGIVAGLSDMRIASASVIAIGIVTVSILAAVLSISRLLGGEQTSGYTMLERVAADPWDLCVVFAAIFTVIPPIIMLVNVALPRKVISGLIHNRVSSAILLLVSALTLLGIPAAHIFANATAYTEFGSTFNFEPVPISLLGMVSGQFLSLMQSGPLPEQQPLSTSLSMRGESDVGLTNNNGASLAGGWITGPGNAKVTMAAATAMCDLAYAMIKFPDEVKQMYDVPALLSQGSAHLTAAYNAQDGTLVAAIFDGGLTETGGEWRRPEQVPVGQRQVRYINGTGPGTDVYAVGAPLVLLDSAAGVLCVPHAPATSPPVLECAIVFMLLPFVGSLALW